MERQRSKKQSGMNESWTEDQCRHVNFPLEENGCFLDETVSSKHLLLFSISSFVTITAHVCLTRAVQLTLLAFRFVNVASFADDSPACEDFSHACVG